MGVLEKVASLLRPWASCAMELQSIVKAPGAPGFLDPGLLAASASRDQQEAWQRPDPAVPPLSGSLEELPARLFPARANPES